MRKKFIAHDNTKIYEKNSLRIIMLNTHEDGI
jgi:hypothetical protein